MIAVSQLTMLGWDIPLAAVGLLGRWPGKPVPADALLGGARGCRTRLAPADEGVPRTSSKAGGMFGELCLHSLEPSWPSSRPC